MEITLEQILAARDHRHALQQQLLARYADCVVICGTVVMPGSVKHNADAQTVADELQRALQGYAGPDSRVEDAVTGFEMYVVSSEDALTLKRAMCAIEDTHPLGRLMDIDVIGRDGVPISRQAVGAAPRRCLLCDHEARWCMRNHTHTTDELLAHIHQMVEQFKQHRQQTQQQE